MQSKLVIAALLGVVSAKDLSNFKHAIVQATEVKNGIQELSKSVNKKLHKEEVAPVRSAADIKKIEDIVGGMLKGALDAEGFDDINSCIADAETIFKDAEDAIKDFETKDTAKIVDGLKKVADILTNVQKGMSDCAHLKADWEKLEKMAAIFSSPQAFAYHVGKDLTVNGADIFHEIEDAVTQYNSGNWLQFGVDIGEAAAKTILGAEEAVQVRSAADIKKLEDIVGGMLKGALDAEGFDDINTCIADAETIFTDAEEAIKDFETKDAGKIIDGIKKVADILNTVQKGMSDCSHLKADWQKLASMASVFSSPQAFAYHVGKDLMVNGVDIFHEIEDAVTEYQAGNWSKFGEDVGEAAAKTILGAESQIQLGANEQQVKLAQIEQGILKAFGGNFDLLALLECIGEEDKALLAFDAAYQTFQEALQKKDWSDAVGGVIMVVAGIQQFKQGLPVCKHIDTTTFKYDQLMSSYDIAVHPTQHFQILEKDLLLNGNAIRKDIRRAVHTYENGDYEEFGFSVGNILELATRPTEQETLPVPQSKEDEEVFTRAMMAEIAQGYLEATGVGEFNFTNLLICIYQADQAAIILYMGVEMLEKAMKSHSINDIMPALISFFAFYGALQQTIPVCESVDTTDANWGTFNHIIDVAEDPEKHMKVIGEDIIFNEVTITSDLAEALDAFRSEDFKTFGYLLGKTMTLATEDNLTLY